MCIKAGGGLHFHKMKLLSGLLKVAGGSWEVANYRPPTSLDAAAVHDVYNTIFP